MENWLWFLPFVRGAFPKRECGWGMLEKVSSFDFIVSSFKKLNKIGKGLAGCWR